MYNPSRDQARGFFVEAWRKHRGKLPLTQLEMIAADIVLLHPEWHALLEDPDAMHREFTPEDGAVNPFLHLSLHLAIEEQLSIDQPPGIRAAFEQAAQRHGNRHDALHDALECLGETLWRSQRDGRPPDGTAYVECLRKKASS